MLTRKQQWRRQKKFISRNQHDFLYEQGLANDTASMSSSRYRSSSEPSISLLLISNVGRLWSTTGDLESKGKPMKKSVNFSGSVHVLLIPTRDEYNNAGLGPLMWWNTSDYSSFKESAITEIKNLMMIDNRIDCKTAQTLLYQPFNDNHKSIKLKLTHFSPRDSISFRGTASHFSEELKDDSLIDDGSRTTSLLDAHIDSIPLTHIRSQVDLHSLVENNKQPHDDKMNLQQSSSSDPLNFFKIHSTPDKKTQWKQSNRSKTMYPDLYSAEATKISHAHAITRQHAIHPLAYLCT